MTDKDSANRRDEEGKNPDKPRRHPTGRNDATYGFFSRAGCEVQGDSSCP